MASCSGSGDAAIRDKKLQVQELQKWFARGPKPDQATRERIANCVGMSPKQVSNWFQNKRAREKAKKLEKEHEELVQELEMAKAENNLIRAKIEDYKSQVTVERQRIQMIQGAPVAAAAMVAPAHPLPQHLFQAAAAAAFVAPAHSPPQHIFQAAEVAQAGFFQGTVSGHTVAGVQVPEQTTFWPWPNQHNFH